MVARLLASIWVTILCYSSAYAYTLTFDDISVGQDLSRYSEHYGFAAARGWEVVDHSDSAWGPPHSGTNLLIWNGNPGFGAAFGFGDDGVSEYTVRVAGAFFSTEPGILLRMTGYGKGGTEVASVAIGATDESWTNRYAEIASAPGEIAFVHITGVNSEDDRYYFCLDDLTIIPVAEPSSVLALGFGGAGIIGAALRRRRHLHA